MNDVVEPQQPGTQWKLDTLSSTYAFSLLGDASGLVLDYWGPKLDGAVPLWDEPLHPTNFRARHDQAPLEFASAGQRHSNFSELWVEESSGRLGVSWSYESSRLSSGSASGRGDSRITVVFVDPIGTLALELDVETNEHSDVVRRRSRVINRSSTATVDLTRAFSAAWNPVVGGAARVEFLAGDWCREFQRHSTSLSRGTFSIGSRHGVTSHSFSPIVLVQPSDERVAGERFGIGLEWSGNWSITVDAEQPGPRVRVSCGIDSDTTTIQLAPGQTFEAPVSIGVWSAGGSEALAEKLRCYHRSRARSLGAEHRPIVYNSWYATEFEVTVDHQIALADRAAELGVEAFVIDDGWFVGRTTDKAGLGDWFVDQNKFPEGLGAFAQRIVERGMRFGLWIEPEAVNPDSDLYREHPEWVHADARRAPQMHRNQLVLNFGVPEVVEWIKGTLRRILDSAEISYLKWDMNRLITDGMHPDPALTRSWSVEHTRGYYEVMQMIRDEYPHVTVEACSAGGGRIDGAVLALADVVWPSDETGPRDRLAIQDGYLSAYPSHAMSSWVTDEVGLNDQSPVSFEFRFLLAMSGVLGIGADILQWADVQQSQAAAFIEQYRSIRATVFEGAIVRHGTPKSRPYSLEYAIQGEPDAPLVLFVFDHPRDRQLGVDSDPVYVRSSLARANQNYRVRSTDRVISGEVLRTLGFEVPFAVANDADLIVLDPCE